MTSSAAHPPARRWLGPAFTTALLIGIAALLLTRGDPAVTLGIFATRFLGIFIEAAPFLLLGTAVSGLLEVFVSREDIVRWLPRSRLAAPFVGAFMGFAFPVCECGVVPVARRLFTKGLPMPVGVAFLLAAPVMNPIVLVSTYIAFGFGPLLIARFAITAAVAILVGLVFALTARPEEVLLPASLAPITGGSGAKVTDRPRLGPGLIRAAQFSVDETFDMGRYLVIGAVVSVIVMQAIAFVLSVCSTVDAFLALAFTGTFTVGSISAFLTFGPMIDVKSTLMFLGVFRRRAVAYLILIPFLLTLLAGVWLNLLLR
ncbi:permease [Anaerolineae bacterium CFX4]|nr:permease [Anaerolineae bacterium CFX4]